MKILLVILLSICIRINNAIPLINYLVNSDNNNDKYNNDYNNDYNHDYNNDYNNYDILCHRTKNYYTSAKIINHSIIELRNKIIENNTNCNLKNISKCNNITFQGIIILEYKILEYCHYICKMPVIANQENSNLISKYFEKYFQIGKVLHITCNNTICNWGNTICNAQKIKDEL